MSRHGGDPYRDPPNGPVRWNAERMNREREYRNNYQDEYYGPPPVDSPQRSSRPSYNTPVYEDRRYYEDDRYGPRGSTRERRYFEEEEYYNPATRNSQVVPFRPPRPEAPPRPGIIRRQSSLDTFDRPPRRVADYERPRARPQRVDMYVPEQPSPRDNRYRPAQRAPPRDYRREYYDDVTIQDPDYYGDEGFREYREREWISSRRRDSPSPARSRAATEVSTKEEVKEEVTEGKGGEVEKESVVEKSETKTEKPYPRRGKTKMPKRLVHTKVLFDLGYTYYEENEKTLVIEKALGPDNIDEIFSKSKEYREKEVGTTRLLEAPPPAETVTRTTTTTVVDVPVPSVREPTPPPSESVHEEEITETITTKPLSEAPRSVREWDNLTADTRGSHRRHRSHSHRRRRSPSPEVKKIIIEDRRRRSPSPEIKQIIIEDDSRARPRRRSRSRRRPSIDVYDEEIIERRIVREDDDYGESRPIPIGPLALMRSRSRPGREVDLEIERVRAPRRYSRFERDDETEIVEFRRRESRSPSATREIMVERRGDDIYLKREKPRSRSKSIPRPPSARNIRNMMYAMT